MMNSNDAHERRPEKAAGKIVLFLLVGLRRLSWRVMRGVRPLLQKIHIICLKTY
jgi:hypothetical protein